MRMRRTTLALDEDLFRALKARAANEGISLGRLVNELLHQAHAVLPPPVRKVKWLTFRGRGVHGGVNLDDRKALWDAIEGTGR